MLSFVAQPISSSDLMEWNYEKAIFLQHSLKLEVVGERSRGCTGAKHNGKIHPNG